jgi:hypothetical protein
MRVATVRFSVSDAGQRGFLAVENAGDGGKGVIGRIVLGQGKAPGTSKKGKSKGKSVCYGRQQAGQMTLSQRLWPFWGVPGTIFMAAGPD